MFSHPCTPLVHQGVVSNYYKYERAECRKTGLVPDDYPEAVADDWPDLLRIIEQLVKPDVLKGAKEAINRNWWQFWRVRPMLRKAIKGLDSMHVLSRVSAHFGIATVPIGLICAESVVVFADQTETFRAVLQSRLHELWAAFFASSLEDRLRYGPSDCFETFAFPSNFKSDATLSLAGMSYHGHRTTIMAERNEGMTKLLNRFHDPNQFSPDITHFRHLHHAMDKAVLRAYGWNDLADSAAPEFLTEDTEPEHRYQGRLFWPAPFRDEVLARLLKLNAEHAADERARGLIPLAAEADELEDA